MKNSNKDLRLLTLIVQVALLTLSNCKKDDLILPSVVQFSLIVQSVTEGSEAMVTISFDKPANKEGTLLVNVGGDASYGYHYATDPTTNNGSFTLNIAKGQSSSQFKVTTVNNTVFAGDRLITFTLNSPSDGLKLGPQTSMIVALVDDEASSKANFAINAGTISEADANGVIVQIPLSTSAKGTGTLSITINSENATYGKDFITSPAPLGNSIALNVLSNDASVSFTILPVHDFSVTKDLQVSFTISTAVGSVQKGTNVVYSLTIINVDQELPIINFAANSGTLSVNNSEGMVVVIPFSSPAPGDGSITISFTSPNNSYGNKFTTVPSADGNNAITLNVATNQDSTSFNVLPMNGFNCSGDISIQWKISFVYGSIKKGPNLDYTLTLKDDEAVSVATFAESSGSISEGNTSGMIVRLNLSKATTGPSSIAVYPYVYPTDNYGNATKFSTNPSIEFASYSGVDIPLNFSAGATSAQFTVYPINNNERSGNYSVVFYAYNGSGCIQIATNSSYALTILDDD